MYGRHLITWILCAVLGAGLLWLGLLLRLRHSLALENHLVRNLALPFVPVGRPVSHPDGRIFLVTAENQLCALSGTGQLLWNKLLPEKVIPQPVLLSSTLLVLQGTGSLHGYSLGGEWRYTVRDGGDLSALPCADEQGNLFLLDQSGALVGLEGTDGQPRQRFRTSLDLMRDRQLLLLPGGQILGAGSSAAGVHEVFLAERNGVVGPRLHLGQGVVGLSVSPVAGESGALSSGGQVLTLDRSAAPVRRIPLPAPALSAPLLTADGSIYVLVQADAATKTPRLCHIAGDRSVSFCVEASSAPLLGRDGRIYAAFRQEGTLFSTYQGVLSVTPEGPRFRQALPGPLSPEGLTLTWGGGVLAVVVGERYLWLMEGGSDTLRGPYHPWPMPTGNPAGSSRPWPEKP